MTSPVPRRFADSGFQEPQMAYVRLLLSLLAVIAAPLGAQTSQVAFPNTTDLGRAMVRYKDNAIQVVAAYNYSQRKHDFRWLQIEIGVATQDYMRIHRDDITLVTPDDRVIPVASQRAFSQDLEPVRLLGQEAAVVQHLYQRIGSYFSGRQGKRFRWFIETALEGTVPNTFDVDFHRVTYGDLYFASPTGTWPEGTYSLVVQGTGETRAVLPIHLD